MTENIKKAGIIPYILTPKGVEMLFMVSSDPFYGGPDPMCSKGLIDPGESPYEAALREGFEELGLRVENFAENPILLMDEKIQGQCDSYILRMYMVEVKSKEVEDWAIPHYETKHTVWLTLPEYYQVGRLNQLNFVREVFKRTVENRLRFTSSR